MVASKKTETWIIMLHRISSRSKLVLLFCAFISLSGLQGRNIWVRYITLHIIASVKWVIRPLANDPSAVLRVIEATNTPEPLSLSLSEMCWCALSLCPSWIYVRPADSKLITVSPVRSHDRVGGSGIFRIAQERGIVTDNSAELRTAMVIPAFSSKDSRKGHGRFKGF